MAKVEIRAMGSSMRMSLVENRPVVIRDIIDVLRSGVDVRET